MAGYRSYSGNEYREAGPSAGPFALESNPAKNYRTNRRVPILGIVMHITAGHSDWVLPDDSADGTTKYGMTTTRQAAWQVVIDSDGIIPGIRDEYACWHAGVNDIANINDATLGIELGTGDTNWRTKPADWVERTLRLAAIWAAPRVVKYGIPLRVERSRTALESAIIGKRKIGFMGHHLINPTNRTDPGLVNGVDTFPWEQFFGYIREEIAILNGTTPIPTGGLSMTDINDLKAQLDRMEKKEDNRYSSNYGVDRDRYSDLAGRLAGLTEAVSQLASGKDVDVEAITAAAKAGTEQAFAGLKAKAETVVSVSPPEPTA